MPPTNANAATHTRNEEEEVPGVGGSGGKEYPGSEAVEHRAAREVHGALTPAPRRAREEDTA